SSDRSPVHTWRAGRLLAFQHHPESDPARVAYWRTRDADGASNYRMGALRPNQAGIKADEVAGSNPVIPTNPKPPESNFQGVCCMYLLPGSPP
ncbi:MAG: hypothetical protein ACFNKE_10715, partial [Neisseria elongata]